MIQQEIDPIDRKAAIEAVSTMFAPLPTQKNMREDCLEILENLPSAQPQRWIPVTERPMPKGLVLVTYNDGDVDLLSQPTAYRRGDIVAWMPLPEPYAEKAGRMTVNEEISVLKAAVAELESKYCENCQELDCDYCRAEADSTERRTDAPTIEPQRWIPCSERLPEPRVDVWVNSDIGQIQGYYEEHIGIWYASFGQGRDYLELIVNAWMPLPEPYKEDET